MISVITSSTISGFCRFLRKDAMNIAESMNRGIPTSRGGLIPCMAPVESSVGVCLFFLRALPVWVVVAGEGGVGWWGCTLLMYMALR